MTKPTQIRDLFLSDVTRDIPPVIYFHEQSPEKLEAEVSEYIITGGWPDDHPNKRRVQDGIHEQYVRLLNGIASELDKPGGADLPSAWISGFYGSGKSSFAKLLGLALDGVELPGGGSLAEAWLKRNTSPKAAELREAWNRLRQKIDPISVVFDIGSIARDQEHIHAAALRQVQRRLGYCSTQPLVADFELKLERDGEWERFEETAKEVLGKPWSEVKDKTLAEEDFSHVLSVMFPERYTDPMSWFDSRAGTHQRSESPQDAAEAIRDMLKFRQPGATLFLVIDEVSQYVVGNKDRADRLRAFATALGSTLKGKVWLLALGQQKLDEDAGDSFLVWAKDRFPPQLRVHLAATNIRDVVHKRLLQKTPEGESMLGELFEKHRADLKLYAYGCENATASEFVEVYPMLPGQIDLILKITSALRLRSTRAQGDDQAIRGLLQLLGELFRSQKLADNEVGRLVTLDQVYEVQHTALDSDVQTSMARVLSQCTGDDEHLMVRAAKAVAMLELIQDEIPTDAALVAQCLYDRVDAGTNRAAITEALEALRSRNLLSYSEKHGYKIQSSAGEEWERDRRDIGVPREDISEEVAQGLKFLIAGPERPRLDGRTFPWAAHFSDGRRADDISLVDPRDAAAVHVDFRYLLAADKTESTWIKRSAETALKNRIVWVAGNNEQVEHLAVEFIRSRAMVNKHKPRRDALSAARKLLLQQEENRSEELEKRLREAVAVAWLDGVMYFRGLAIQPNEQGTSFASALEAVATRFLPNIFSRFVSTQISPTELLQLLEPELSGPSPKFLTGELGILELDSGRYVPSNRGLVPDNIDAHIKEAGGLSGASLIHHFGGPPYGYTANVVKACVAGLLRASKLRIQPDGGSEITAIRDAGVRDLFEKDRSFRNATIFPAGEDDIGLQARARICKFFEVRLRTPLDREDHAIADAAANLFPELAKQLRGVEERLAQLPGSLEGPKIFEKLAKAFEDIVRVSRQTKRTVQLIKTHLDTLNDGVELLQLYAVELTEEAVLAVREVAKVLDHHYAQLREIGVVDGSSATNVEAAAERIGAQLKLECPWREIHTLEADVEEIRQCYIAERRRLLEWQEQESEAARLRVKRREGFSALTGEKSHAVLRPIQEAVVSTSEDALAPALIALRDPFLQSLERAEDRANEILDGVLSEGIQKPIRRVDLGLRNREVASEEDVEALVDEIKTRLLEQIRAGARVRLS